MNCKLCVKNSSLAVLRIVHTSMLFTQTDNYMNVKVCYVICVVYTLFPLQCITGYMFVSTEDSVKMCPVQHIHSILQKKKMRQK